MITIGWKNAGRFCRGTLCSGKLQVICAICRIDFIKVLSRTTRCSINSILGVSLIVVVLSQSMASTSDRGPVISVRVQHVDPPEGVYIQTFDTEEFEFLFDERTKIYKYKEISKLMSHQTVSFFDVIAKWPDIQYRLSVSIPRYVPRGEVFIRIIRSSLPPTLASIKRIKNRGMQGENAYKAYYESRRIFKEKSEDNEFHQVTIASAYLWFKSSFELAKRYRGIVIVDPLAIQAVEKILANYGSERSIRGAMKIEGIDLAEIQEMIREARILEFSSVLSIQQIKNENHCDDAQEINEYYRQYYKSLSDGSKNLLETRYGITESTFEKNQNSISQICALR